MQSIVDVIQPIKLLKGTHDDTGATGQGCAMNVIAYLNGEPQITDQSPCVCVAIRPYLIHINDEFRDSTRHQLIPYMLRAMGSATDDKDTLVARAWLLADFAKQDAASAASAASDASDASAASAAWAASDASDASAASAASAAWAASDASDASAASAASAARAARAAWAASAASAASAAWAASAASDASAASAARAASAASDASDASDASAASAAWAASAASDASAARAARAARAAWAASAASAASAAKREAEFLRRLDLLCPPAADEIAPAVVDRARALVAIAA